MLAVTSLALCRRISLVQASAAQSSEVKLEEVFVTARKTLERPIDVPLSMIARTDNAMRERRLQEVLDLDNTPYGSLSDTVPPRGRQLGVSASYKF